jgi:hypothetical protein
MSARSSKTSHNSNKFGSPTTPLEPGIFESSTNSNMSQTPRKNPSQTSRKNPPPTRKSNVKATRTGVNPSVVRELFPIREEDVKMTGNLEKLSVKRVAEEASRKFGNKSLNSTKNTLGHIIYEKFTSLKNKNLNPTDRGRLERTISSVSTIENAQNVSINNVDKLSNYLSVLEEIETKYTTKTAPKFLNENQQTIKKLDSRLSRVKNKHKKATSLVSKLVKETKNKNEETVPITKRTVIRNTSKINSLTRQMESLKNVSNLERSKLLGLIVSLARKKKNLTESIVNVRKAGTIKNKEVTKLKKDITAYENKIDELQKIITKVKQEKNKPTMIKTVTRPRSITETDVKKIVKQMTNAKVPTTPPGITKTNLQQFLAPFKQPVSIKFAPSIRATGGAGGNATIIQTKNSAKKKQQPPKKQETPKTPLTRRKQSAIESKRKKLLDRYSPLVIKHKKDALAIINKLLSELKATRSEKSKLISLYSKSLSDKHIKSIFKHRTKDGLRSILVKQLKIVRKKR